MSHFPPEGGCFVKCLSPMPCGHTCPKICKMIQYYKQDYFIQCVVIQVMLKIASTRDKNAMKPACAPVPLDIVAPNGVTRIAIHV